MCTEPGHRSPGDRRLEPAGDPDYVRAQTGQVIAAFLTDEPLEDRLSDARARTATDAMGAVVTFDGVVRDHDGGRGVAGLSYSAHPRAGEVMAQVAAEVVERHPHVRLWAAHRTGHLRIGETAFLVVVAAAHRAAAFAAASEVVDTVKARVPVWKEQTLADGATQWVGLE